MTNRRKGKSVRAQSEKQKGFGPSHDRMLNELLQSNNMGSLNHLNQFKSFQSLSPFKRWKRAVSSGAVMPHRARSQLTAPSSFWTWFSVWTGPAVSTPCGLTARSRISHAQCFQGARVCIVSGATCSPNACSVLCR